VSIGFLLFSMVFSRWLFKRIKGRKGSIEEIELDQ
jgi:hypothetical protein